MNECRKITVSFLLLLGAALPACTPSGTGSPPLEGASLGGPFALTDQNDRSVTDADFAGRYRLIYFGFTHCPDVCPTDLQQLGQGLRQFEQAHPELGAKVQPIFVTVDPERDTPPVLREYVAAFHPRLIGLTGTQPQIAEMARRYGNFFSKEQAPGATDYVMNHGRTLTLYGAAGKPIALVPHDQGADAIAAELERWVR